MIASSHVKPLAALLPLLLVAVGCAADPPLRSPRLTHGGGFVLEDDGTVSVEEIEKLQGELVDSEKRIMAILGKDAWIADFRTPEERERVACPIQRPAEIHVTISTDQSGRCHADETGLTILRHHIDRKDGTHELVHYLAGGSWRPIDEGLAVYLTERLQGPAGGVSVDLRSRVYMDLSLDENLDRDRMRGGMSRIDYDLAASFVKWLIEERGLGPFMTLFHGPPGDYHGVYGISEQELISKWREKIRATNVKLEGPYWHFREFMSR
jgi:hypothetical protein